MDIAYAAHTESCTFMLDAEGICRWVVASNPASPHKARHWEKSQQAAARCIGAQYVASLDISVAGGLVNTPVVGVPMLFARVDENGRVSLVRTGPVLRFEDRTAGEEQAYDSGMRERPVEDPDTCRIERSEHIERSYNEAQAQDGREDEKTTPFQMPPNVVQRPKRAAPPAPTPPPRGISRLPAPSPPPMQKLRERGSLPPPPTNNRATVSTERVPPPEAHRTSGQPLWTDRAQVALRRAR